MRFCLAGLLFVASLTQHSIAAGGDKIGLIQYNIKGPSALAVHPDRHQQRYVANLAGPAALEHDAVQVNVGCSPSIGRLRHASIVP
jgi:hypothetical protein